MDIFYNGIELSRSIQWGEFLD